MAQGSGSFGFGNFLLNTDENVLLFDGKPVSITPKTLQLLSFLVRNHGRIVEKADIMEEVWAGSFVEDSNLTFTIRKLRKVLGDNRAEPVFIQTVPRRGYRFIADVRHVGDEIPAAASKPVRPSKPNRHYFFLAALLISVGTAAAALLFLVPAGSEPEVWANFAPLSRFETVATSGNSSAAAISPDGNYVAYTLTTNGREGLWVRELASGSSMQIVAPEEDVHFSSVEFSPDGNSIYFLRNHKGALRHLDRVALNGGPIESGLLSDIEDSFSISPDGRRVSFRRMSARKRFLLTSNIDGSDTRTIFETEGLITDNSYSPDGRSIAFAAGQSDTGDRDFGVFIGDPQTGNVKPATDFRWYYVRGIMWLPDRSGLLVTARIRNVETQQVWKISLSDGSVERISESQNSFGLISGSADLSRVLLSQTTLSSYLYLSDAAEMADDRLVTRSWSGVTWAGEDQLVYVSRSSGNNDIWLINSKDDTQLQLTVDEANEFNPVVSPDLRYVVYVSDKGGRNNIWRINIDGTHPVQLTKTSGEQAPVFSPDGKFIYYNLMRDRHLWKVPVEGGEPIPVSDHAAYRVAISPDGSKYAYFSRDPQRITLNVRSFRGDAVEVLEIPEGYSPPTEQIAWTSDGKGLVYALTDGRLISNLWKRSLVDGTAEKLTRYSTDTIFHFAFCADSSRFAIVRGSWNHDLVLASGVQRWDQLSSAAK